MGKNRWRAALGAWVCALLAPASGTAGEFSVNPTRLELGAAARSGAITVRNEGKEPLSFQLQALEWAQDASGKDIYQDGRDLIFFPKILTIAPDQEAVIRVGTKTPVVPVEKTYRLFIEELPGAPKESEAKGAQITFLIRFGAPVFITPLKPQDGLELTGVALARGELNLSAKNTGNRHQVIEGIYLTGSDASGKEVYALRLADRYLLAGAVKAFKATIPSDHCTKIAALDVEVKTDKVSAKHKMDVTRSMCAPK